MLEAATLSAPSRVLKAPEVVTASRLTDGATLYLAFDGTWSTVLAEAALAPDERTLKGLTAAAEASARRQEVVSVYSFPVRDEDGRPEAVSVRERIRASGRPSIDPPSSL